MGQHRRPSALHFARCDALFCLLGLLRLGNRKTKKKIIGIKASDSGAARIVFKLPELEAGTVARHDALTSLDNIRKVMRLRDLRRERIAKAKPLPVCNRLTRCRKTVASRLGWS
jgi:hypothetical protein